jgi:hypothetical protein
VTAPTLQSTPLTALESEPQPAGEPDRGSGRGTILEERPVEVPTDAGDHDRFAHYVRKEKIVESAVSGTPVVALCGKVWVPNRDPGRFPVCPECKEIYERLPPGDDGAE